MTVDEYEDITPWELSVSADSYADRQRQVAYLQALTIRTLIMSGLNGKSAPSYETMFGNLKIESEPMDDDALFRAVLAANGALGGENYLSGKGVS